MVGSSAAPVLSADLPRALWSLRARATAPGVIKRAVTRHALLLEHPLWERWGWGQCAWPWASVASLAGQPLRLQLWLLISEGGRKLWPRPQRHLLL